MSKTTGWKTYLAAAGLMALAIWQTSQGDHQVAVQTFLAGFAVLGLRHAIGKGKP